MYKNKWKGHVHKLMLIHNIMKYSSSGYLPHYIMLGRKPKHVISIILKADEQTTSNHRVHLKLEGKMKEAYKVTLKHLGDCKSKVIIQRKDYKAGRATSLQPGNLICNLSQ